MIWFERAVMLSLLAPLILCWWYLAQPSRLQRRTLAGIPLVLREAFVSESLGIGGRVVRGLYLVLGCLLVLALAEPRLAGPNTENKAQLAWVLALDLSETSVESPEDLLALKMAARSMIDESTGSSVALVAFSGSAHWVLPPTRDTRLLSRFLEALEPSLMPASGRDLEKLGEALVNHPSFNRDLSVVVLGKSSAVSAQPNTVATLSQFGLRVLTKAFDRDENGSISLDLMRESSSGTGANGIALDRYLVIAAFLISCVLWRKNLSRALVSSVFVFVFLTASPSPTQAQSAVEMGAENPHVAFAEKDPSASPIRPELAIDWLLGVFLTPDQRGGLWLYLDNPKRAATSFDTPIYRAWAYYLAGDFRMAAQAAQQDRSDVARFLEANAWAHGKSYGQALRIYDEILAANPDHREAAHNRQQVWDLVVASAEQGESQMPDTGELVRLESDASDKAVTTQSDEAAILMTLEADRLLSDPEALRRWRAQVEADPRRFLANRFALEARLQETGLSEQKEQKDER